MNLKTAIANKANYGNIRSLTGIKYLVFHYTANDGDTDEANARYFQNNIVKASAHYFVDDDSVTQSVPDNYVAWAVGGNKYNNAGGSLYGKCTNTNSISIELCDTVKNGVNDFTEATLKNAVELGKLIMKKYNIPIENVIRHYDVVGKNCPKPFVESENAWNIFKRKLIEGDRYMIKNIEIAINGKIVTVPAVEIEGRTYPQLAALGKTGDLVIAYNEMPLLDFKKNEQVIKIDEKEIEVSTIKVADRNYVRLSDLAKSDNISVVFDKIPILKIL